ncbi:LacI family DNA-binding transcriptional regulator [Metabacillus idriensis]|uniref:LacI family DNA-binding transcriptional regulator n=1 Tax=Metabacillus idriensis TaxID=324768 RepID=UPI0028144F65|nr:LacI family DNA-binding transcriptional regulator [Metabacillus idriensis]MDR0140075.1 LacI family DNA-binding transcriptional regulator [Metabacillus idriensis]
MTTIKDIALLSNVSASTVSRVLNNDKSISVQEETRLRIFEAAKELGYRTIHERRITKRTKKTNLSIGIVVCQSLEEELDDPYFLSIRQGIEEELKNQGINKSAMFRLYDMETNQMVRDLDGILVIGIINDQALKMISDHSDNVVYVNHSPDEDLYDSVIIDFEKGTERALKHLLNAGHREIGFIGGVEREHLNHAKVVIENQRLATFERIMEKEGLLNQDSIFIGEYKMSSGYELMKKALNQPVYPKAFFISSDPMAIGALRAIQEADLSVPEDVAVIGFDDIEMAKFCSTPLTTVKVHTKEMGKTGVKLLIDRINGRKMPLKVTVSTELVIRQSCGVSKDVI